MSYELSLILIAGITSLSAAILGVFLVIRKMSMIIDAISHTVLFGIVIGFIIVKDVTSPLLIILATATGLLTTFLIEMLVKSRRVTEDAATGVVFPLIFSISIILISSDYLKGAHIGPDTTFLGQLELTPIKLIKIGSLKMPSSLFYASILLFIVIIFVIIFYKELKVVSFDYIFAGILGISINLIHYLLMSLVSVTAVLSFDIMGAIMIISLMVGPAATALLLTKKLYNTILVSTLVAIINVVIGVFLGLVLNVEISALIAVSTIVLFILVLLVNPNSGLISRAINRNKLKNTYNLIAFIMHINNHYRNQKINLRQVSKELNWSLNKVENIYNHSFKNEYLKEKANKINITKKFIDLCETYE